MVAYTTVKTKQTRLNSPQLIYLQPSPNMRNSNHTSNVTHSTLKEPLIQLGPLTKDIAALLEALYSSLQEEQYFIKLASTQPSLNHLLKRNLPS
jgi:hypothetical protein